MITNERQYRIANAELKRFGHALATHESERPSPDVDPRIHRAMGDALESEAAELQQQLKDYEDLREGRTKVRTLQSLAELPKTIIEARIARRTTQKGLAGLLGVAEQQIQRWEATHYAGVGVDRLQKILDALGASIVEKVEFAKPTKSAKARKPTRSSRSAKSGVRGAASQSGRITAKSRSGTARKTASARSGRKTAQRARRTTGRSARSGTSR